MVGGSPGRSHLPARTAIQSTPLVTRRSPPRTGWPRSSVVGCGAALPERMVPTPSIEDRPSCWPPRRARSTRSGVRRSRLRWHARRGKENPVEGSDLKTAEAVIDNGSFGKRTVRFETGVLAQQAGGSAVVHIDDDTMLLSATTASSSPREGMDFFPLTVEVEERMYAAGRIPGAFFRREGRPSEGAILACRLIDRPLRPCFTKGLRNDVNVIVTVMALNPEVLYDV